MTRKTPPEWFAEAARCYVEQHQGCAWCGGSYRVFHLRRGAGHEYFCNGCDFRVSYDPASARYVACPGEAQTAKPGTMYEI